MALASAGVVAPIGIEGWTLNTELTHTALNPQAALAGLRTLGRLSRATARLTTPVADAGDTALDAQIALEHVSQHQDAADFGVVLSRDRYAALRLGIDLSAGIAHTGTSITAFTQWSSGLGGRTANPQAPSEPTLSRQGASPRFQRMDALLRITQPLGRSLSLAAVASGQSAFGKPLMQSEQFTLSGQDKVSGNTAGSLAVDQGATLRGELSWSLPASTSGPRPIVAAPYLFAAAGRGRLMQPTAVEQARLNARSAGLGLRAAQATRGAPAAQLNLELAHVSGVPRDDGRRWQLSLLASVAW